MSELTAPPSPQNGWTFVSLRAYLEALIVANDRRYEQRFVDSQTAVAAALAAVKLGADAALIAQKDAVLKAEIASEKRFEVARVEADFRLNELSKQIGDLEGGLSGLGGRTTGMKEMWGYFIGAVGIILAFLAYLAKP